jgi:hypothetical protein
MKKKYFVYVGSTLDDLKSERRELPRIIMELGHIPVSADYLDHDDEHTPRMVNKTIGECDYFISLVAHRYCADGEKISPMESEYAQAVSSGVPVIALVIDEKARWKAAKKEKEPGLIRKLDDFKADLRTHSHETWINTADLRQKAQHLLIQAINLDPRPGWVPAEQAINPALANEVARLSSENEELKRRFRMESGKILARLREQIKHAIRVLSLNGTAISFYYTAGENWENTRKFRYLRIFKVLAPELSLGKTTVEISRFLGNVLNPDLEKTVRKDYPTPSNTIKKIMADLALLKLVKCAGGDTANGGGGDNEIWEITEYGKELYAVYRLRQLERALEKNLDK